MIPWRRRGALASHQPSAEPNFVYFRESARPMRPVMLSSVPDLVASKYGALKSPSHAIRLYGDTAADTAKNASEFIRACVVIPCYFVLSSQK